MARTDVIVLGAGIVGTSAALHLAKRGVAVTLIDRRAPGEETSYGNAGVIESNTLFPHPFPAGIAALLRIALKQGNRLLARNPRDRRSRVRFDDRRQQRRRPQHVAHRVELDDEQALLDLLVVIARAQHAGLLVPDTRSIAEKEFAVERNLARAGGLLQMFVSIEKLGH